MKFIFFLMIFCMSLCAFAAEDPWNSTQVLQPQQFVEILKNPKNGPVILHVGFQFLYKNNHIPGSKYVGPANEESGLNHLKTELEKIPRDREVVIYCGCCPLTKCPNMRPAFKAVQAMGFKNIKILNLPENLKKDWIEKNYPVEKG